MKDRQLVVALSEVLDPELGMNIVDFGLVYRADRTPDGIVVEIGVPPTCPAARRLAEQARLALSRHFPNVRDIAIDVRTDKPWSPDRLTETGRRTFFWGLQADEALLADDTASAPTPFEQSH